MKDTKAICLVDNRDDVAAVNLYEDEIELRIDFFDRNGLMHAQELADHWELRQSQGWRTEPVYIISESRYRELTKGEAAAEERG